MQQQITLRPVTAADQAVLFDIYASTRWEELAVTGWSDTEKQAFLAMQFELQQRHYRQAYAGAEFSLIEADRMPAGRLYCVDWSDEIRIIDIALLPPYRNRGIGASLISDIQCAAAACGKCVSVHVEQTNPARVLYGRLGFKPVEEFGFYTKMHWSPSLDATQLSAGWVNTAS